MSLTLHFLLLALFQFHFSFATSNHTGLSLRAVLDDSPSSPIYLIENLTIVERMERLIKITNARVSYLDLILRPNANVAPENIQIPILRESLFYVLALTMGSQQHQVKLLMDTGSGLIWTQCQPCVNCFPQNLPIYDPRDSTSYRTLPCSHPVCHGDNRLYDCVNGLCVYEIRYGGGGFTKGVVSLEKFQFYVDNQNRKSFNNVIFGCSKDNGDIAFENTDISGIFGLSSSPVSMFSPLTNSRFSYCFVPIDDVMPHPMILRFGDDIPQVHQGQVGTTLFSYAPPRGYHFYLELLDISVANHRLGFHPDTFRVRPDVTGGCMIDSGTVMSLIDANTPGINAYEAVMAVFEAYYGSRNLERTTGSEGLELCYKTPPNYHDFAPITFHFNGADYSVDGQRGH